MPIPIPHKGEKEDAFIGRCMGNDVMVTDYPDEDQRLAICFSQFKRKDQHKTKAIFRSNNATGVAELYIYEPIDNWVGMGAKEFNAQLTQASKSKELHIRINSDGGDVFDGVAIYNALARLPQKKTVFIDSLAASIASVIAMAGDEIRMANNAMMMVHNPWGRVVGTSEEMRSRAKLLDQVTENIRTIYAKRTGLEADNVAALMNAETWMTATEAMNNRFADLIVDPVRMAAKVKYDLTQFKHAPSELVNRCAGLRPHLDGMRGKADHCNTIVTHFQTFQTYLRGFNHDSSL